jgi:hypothetical protein
MQGVEQTLSMQQVKHVTICQWHTVSHEPSVYVQKGSNLKITLRLHFIHILFTTNYAQNPETL